MHRKHLEHGQDNNYSETWWRWDVKTNYSNLITRTRNFQTEIPFVLQLSTHNDLQNILNFTKHGLGRKSIRCESSVVWGNKISNVKTTTFLKSPSENRTKQQNSYFTPPVISLARRRNWRGVPEEHQRTWITMERTSVPKFEESLIMDNIYIFSIK